MHASLVEHEKSFMTSGLNFSGNIRMVSLPTIQDLIKETSDSVRLYTHCFRF